MISILVGIFVSVLAVSYVGVWVVRAVALRFGILDHPNERSSHTSPTPVGGGVVLLLTTLPVLLVFGLAERALSPTAVLSIAAGAVLVATISLLDDLGHVPVRYRLAGQGIAALCVIGGYGSFYVIQIPVFGTIQLVFGTGITLLWIMGLTNAFNFVDGLDGMAAGQAAAAGTGWIALGGLSHDWVLALTGAALVASNFGFLAHNWYPARIFMGDIGSTFLGYILAVTTVIGAHHDSRLALAGILLAWPAIFDSVFTVARRLAHRQPIFTGHRTFLFHRLVASGWTHPETAALYLVLPLLGALLAFTWDDGTRPLHRIVFPILASLCLCLWLLVRRQERRAQRRSQPVPASYTPTPAPLLEVELDIAETGTCRRHPARPGVPYE